MPSSEEKFVKKENLNPMQQNRFMCNFLSDFPRPSEAGGPNVQKQGFKKFPTHLITSSVFGGKFMQTNRNGGAQEFMTAVGASWVTSPSESRSRRPRTLSRCGAGRPHNGKTPVDARFCHHGVPAKHFLTTHWGWGRAGGHAAGRGKKSAAHPPFESTKKSWMGEGKQGLGAGPVSCHARPCPPQPWGGLPGLWRGALGPRKGPGPCEIPIRVSPGNSGLALCINRPLLVLHTPMSCAGFLVFNMGGEKRGSSPIKTPMQLTQPPQPLAGKL